MDLIESVIVTPLKQIRNSKGDLFHIIKKSEATFEEFGEAYFTSIHHGDIKGWKKHTRMILNLVVPVGRVEFIMYDEVANKFKSVILSPQEYGRLSVPSGLWMAFRGIDNGLNLILNVASIEHDPAEAENLPLEAITYDWH